MARHEGFARAGGPVLVALLHEHVGALGVFGSLGVFLLALAPMMWISVVQRRGNAAADA